MISWSNIARIVDIHLEHMLRKSRETVRNKVRGTPEEISIDQLSSYTTLFHIILIWYIEHVQDEESQFMETPLQWMERADGENEGERK